MSTQRRRTTLADVAERAGMSKAAVSMIMNDRPGSRLSADAVERVRAAAAELDYRPNPAAQVLRRGKTKTIGFISDEVTLTRHASGLIGGALEVSKAHDHTMLIAETEGIEGGLARAFETMIDHRVDGILIGLLGARLIDLPATSTGVPVVVLNGASSSGHANVLPDERAAGYAVAKRLVDAGHRRIGVVGDLPQDVIDDPRQTATVALRFAGIAAAFAEAGIEPARVDIVEWQPEPGYEATTELLAHHPDVTAILAANDGVAFGAYQVLLEQGRRIPQDVSVVSFDDEILAGYLRPGLTTARLPYQEIGALGASMLLGQHALGHELVTMPIIERDSLIAAVSTDAG
ncbi:transcriptional regulator, LacI family [Plantibacter flavus]|uniref:LacI family transcriptional regulator n=1 Tax=Plantibacter flavus TaxID=150123 RepID=A0A3N2C512_9MICO|nr:LacI family DNA-binding transcriptional regulator [Plantibacter flavus]ROR82611.1 LacI family transcriptional regulator [Plantibacter flavus]SMG38961.1 transcriptional regulator, LacI family [Plantibacter flavus]